MPDKLESLSLSGSAWIRISFSGTSGNSENVVVVSIWLVGICLCELLILGCFQISRALRRKIQVCFMLQQFFFQLAVPLPSLHIQLWEILLVYAFSFFPGHAEAERCWHF